MATSMRDARIGGADVDGDPRPERVADGPHRQARVAGRGGADGGAEVVALARPAGERALAAAGAAEREADDRAADARQALRRVIDDAIVQGAAQLGMRWRDDRHRARRPGRFVDARLETAGRAVEMAHAGGVRHAHRESLDEAPDQAREERGAGDDAHVAGPLEPGDLGAGDAALDTGACSPAARACPGRRRR